MNFRATRSRAVKSPLQKIDSYPQILLRRMMRRVVGDETGYSDKERLRKRAGEKGESNQEGYTTGTVERKRVSE